MRAFALGVDAMFRDRNMARTAIHRAGGVRDPHSVRVILRAPDRVGNFGDGRFVTDTIFLDVRVREVARLLPGDTFELEDGNVLEVRSEPVRDSERLCWAAEVRLL